MGFIPRSRVGIILRIGWFGRIGSIGRIGNILGELVALGDLADNSW